MDANFLLGALMMVYGVVTLIIRKVAPDRFLKLEPMKKKWGEKAAVRIHVIGYTVLPLVAGVVLIIRGLA